MKNKQFVLPVIFVLCFVFVPLGILGQASRIIGGPGVERANAIVKAFTPANGYVMVGFTTSYGPGVPDHKNAVIVRTNPDGTPVNSVIAGGNDDEEATSIIRTSDQCYVVTGWTRSYNTYKNYSDIFVTKLNPDLSVVWAKVYHLSPYDLDHQANSIIEASAALNGGYALTGFACGPTSATRRILVMRLDASGNVSWARTYSNGTNLNNEGYGITEVFDDSASTVKLAIVGHTSYDQGVVGDAFMMRLSSYGSVFNDTTLFNGNYEDYAQTVVWDGSGSVPGIIMAGWTKSIGAGWPIYTNIWAARIKAIDGSASWAYVYYWDSSSGGIERDDKVLGDKSLIIPPGVPGSGYTLAGLTYSRGPQAGTAPNVLLMHLNADGSIGWNSQGTVHPSFTLYNNSDEAYGITASTAIPGLEPPGDGFAIAGWSNSYYSSTPPPDDKILLSTFAGDGTRPNGCALHYTMLRSSFTISDIYFSTYTNAASTENISLSTCTLVSQEFCPGKL
ncbi:MAG: hypothetical protein MUF15_03920 [Acidobacteria bacterium]|nr:hypothetical protein [Acidobacteriota bacterium]